VSRTATAASTRKRAAAAGREPDHVLSRRPDVAYRAALRLRELDDAAAILAVLSEAAIPLGYLLLLPATDGGNHAAYVGLGTAEVADLAIRLAARGILVLRGEELGRGPAAMRNRIDRCDVATKGATPSPKGATPLAPTNRRTP
jgi:hypothetical protein